MNYTDRLEQALSSIDGAPPEFEESIDSFKIVKHFGCSAAMARAALAALHKSGKIDVLSRKGKLITYVATKKRRDTSVETLCSDIIDSLGNSLYGALGVALRTVALKRLDECTDIELANEVLKRFMKREKAHATKPGDELSMHGLRGRHVGDRRVLHGGLRSVETGGQGETGDALYLLSGEEGRPKAKPM